MITKATKDINYAGYSVRVDKFKMKKFKIPEAECIIVDDESIDGFTLKLNLKNVEASLSVDAYVGVIFGKTW